MLLLSATGVFSAAHTKAASLCTAMLSPVSALSSDISWSEEIILPSAGSLAPVSTHSMSPTTTSPCGIIFTSPPRMTFTSVSSPMRESASNAFALLSSMTTVMVTESATATSMPTHSTMSKCPPVDTLIICTTTEMTSATSRMMSMGSSSASPILRRTDLGFSRVKAFLPYFSRLSSTRLSESPASGSTSSVLSTSRADCMYSFIEL